MPPRTLVTKRTITYGPIMRLPFGVYAQVTIDGDNTMMPRTVGAVAIMSTGNAKGCAHFFVLDTGWMITAKTWNVRLITKDVIDRVHRLARMARATVRMGLTGSGRSDVARDRVEEDGYDRVYEDSTDRMGEGEDDVDG